MELKEKDMKLLSYLYHNNREPLTKIAKATKMTREQVDYNLKRYIKLGLIKRFVTIFNYKKFGYNQIAVLLIKLEKFKFKVKFCNWLKKSRNCLSFGLMIGEYDLYSNLVFKDEKQLNEFIIRMIQENKKEIEDYLVIRPYFVELFPLKFLNSRNEESFSLIQESEEIRLDEKEKEILRILEKDNRARLIDIASKLRISSELALHKLRKLKKEGIILGSRIQFNMSKLGYKFCQIWINIKDLSEENQEKIKRFCKNSLFVNSLILSIGTPNSFIQLFYKKEEELEKTIEELRELFKEENISIKITLAKDEEEINTLPFLF